MPRRNQQPAPRAIKIGRRLFGSTLFTAEHVAAARRALAGRVAIRVWWEPSESLCMSQPEGLGVFGRGRTARGARLDLRDALAEIVRQVDRDRAIARIVERAIRDVVRAVAEDMRAQFAQAIAGRRRT